MRKRTPILMLALAGSMPGCRGAPEPIQPAESVERAEPAVPVLAGGDDWRSLGAPAPINSAATRGLEVQMWVVENSDHGVARLLSGYDTGSGLFDERERQRWKSWGFRWCVVPISEVRALLTALRPIQPARVQWLGEFTGWRPLVRGGTVEQQAVRVGGGQSQVPAGKPRIIARSWIQPMMNPSRVRPGVRTDLAVQIELPRPQRRGGLIGNPGLPMIDDDGPVLGGLMSTIHADGHHALVLVADSADRDWGALPASIGARGADPVVREVGPASDPVLVEESSETELAAPMPGTGRRSMHGPGGDEAQQSLGELMFLAPGSGPVARGEVYDPPRSVVLILIPRTEGGYALLPTLIHDPALVQEKETE